MGGHAVLEEARLKNLRACPIITTGLKNAGAKARAVINSMSSVNDPRDHQSPKNSR
jgi:hypothetical protein